MDKLSAWDAFFAQYVTVQRAGYVAFAVALFLMAILTGKLWRDRGLARSGRTTGGTIVRVSEEDDVEHAIIRFRDASGQEHEFRSDLPRQIGSLAVGAAVTVRYDPTEPTRARQVGEPLRRLVHYFIYLLVAGVFAFIGFKFVTAPP